MKKNKYHPNRVKSFIIDRKTWGNGSNGNGGSLLTGDGFRCCLSFYSEAAGTKLRKMKGLAMPSSLCEFGKNIPVGLECLINKITKHDDNTISKKLASVNDSTANFYSNPIKRESQIKKLFAQIGVKVKFIN